MCELKQHGCPKEENCINMFLNNAHKIIWQDILTDLTWYLTKVKTFESIVELQCKGKYKIKKISKYAVCKICNS